MTSEIRSHINDTIGSLPRPDPTLPNHVLDMFSLKGKVASITGSATGIGYEVATAYAQAGADIALWYYSKFTPESDAEAQAERIRKATGVTVRIYSCEITSSAEVEATINQQEADFGTIDIFVANAGIPWVAGPMIDAKGDNDWHKVISVDLDGVYYCAKNVGKIFRKNGKGSFIITGSMSGHIVNVPQLQAAYNAAKAACIHLGKSLAVEWAGFARVNSVSPGYIKTEISDFLSVDIKSKWWQLTPVGREGLPKELVGAYLYLASDASTYTTGSDIRVDGGYCLP
ncbi:hypothetical protein BABINDRAFT_160467 [Babjeviella inositovora NRRL Y-12698]|uniref:Uncharacterized protein n=1 Tax=Babjeviella inositovora NRRL Y-12698 TaxID=984486 RepID=A0A1E3QTQ3_9ASCO|nr:uncharacterized protein BABINDRAFT_160467 [Babjeviella inositovora NRRL Y-12698]ODQ81050.1 hypothetical protein BABINDRAFT_160467 [Babjeviella inositovora NRRL Y-12698]